MSTIPNSLTLQLSAAAMDGLAREAAAKGESPAKLAAAALERRYGSAGSSSVPLRPRSLEHFFGCVDLGGPTDLDNEAVDADILRGHVAEDR